MVTQAVAHGGFDRYWLFEPNQAVHTPLRQAAGGKPTEILTDMTDLSPVPDGSVGLAVMIHVLDHLLDPLAMLRSIYAKLKPGGALLTDP
ncbi:class I SAM-dependent methyltransferase [Sphingobium sp.]|uniref:class I SAM-dependent methyltransferase n=1 Tax=Sphingobium sp. TaxID=1912891 RepID=UPI003B3B036B